MEEYVPIPKRDFYRMLNLLERLEPLVQEKKETLVSKQEAMRLLGVGKTKLWELCRDGDLQYTNSGKGRNVQIYRKSIEKFQNRNSNK